MTFINISLFALFSDKGGVPCRLKSGVSEMGSQGPTPRCEVTLGRGDYELFAVTLTSLSIQNVPVF